MNFRRMRSRLMAGEYDDRRGGIMRLMEDVDWIRHNCTVFNGVSLIVPLVEAQSAVTLIAFRTMQFSARQ